VSDEKKAEVISIDRKRLDNMAERGHYQSMWEEFEILRLKFLHEDVSKIPKQEAIRLITLTKYMIKYGHSEPFQLSCQYFYDKYIKPFDL